MRSLARSLLLSIVLGACGGGGKAAPRPPVGNTVVPAGGAATGSRLAAATKIEIRDVWVGLGCTHELTATLTAQGGGWSGPAQLATGWDHDKADQKTITIDAAVIASLDRAVDAARARMATTQAPEGGIVSGWTDDYPTGSMAFTTPAGIYQLGFTDQHRKLVLEHDQDSIPLDRDQDIFDGQPSEIWEAYSAVLVAAGLPAWIDAMCDRR